MSRKSKISLLVAFLLLVATFAVKFMTGMWLNLNSILLGVAILAIAATAFFDAKLYWEFLTMRTTKHGMNMGLLIVLFVVFLVSLNYQVVRHNKSWDTTQEKLNSLADQSVKVLKSLADDVQIKVFYAGPAAQDERQKVKQALGVFSDESNRLKISFLNSYVETAQAVQYLSALPDRDTSGVFVFMEYQGRKVRVDAPYDEAQITAALIKVTRTTQAKIYFVKGHGERDIESNEDPGMKEFAKALGEASYQTESLSLIDRKEIPKDASVLAIVGPSVPYLEGELAWIRQYLLDGGRLFLALDPGQRHNLAGLVKTLGGEFLNNYVITMSTLTGAGPATVLGRGFDSGSEITRNLPAASSFAVFPLISEVRPALERTPGFAAAEIVKSDPMSFTVTDMREEIKAKPATAAVTLALELTGQLEKGIKPFAAVLFGDSDFISNRMLALGLNRDLAMNSIAQLTDQKDLISIRPKEAKATVMTMTDFSRWFVLIAGLALPVLLLVLAGVMWFRRRGA